MTHRTPKKDNPGAGGRGAMRRAHAAPVLAAISPDGLKLEHLDRWRTRMRAPWDTLDDKVNRKAHELALERIADLEEELATAKAAAWAVHALCNCSKVTAADVNKAVATARKIRAEGGP